MNIYIRLELEHRELDSKLLLAVLAASRGHKIILTDLSDFMCGVKKGLFLSGVFHTKSLTPGQGKIKKHEYLKKQGFLITSQDEEAGVTTLNYEDFARNRFSEKTVSQADLIFCWGETDYRVLQRMYPKSGEKIKLTGSPRIDLLQNDFSNYWEGLSYLPKKNYVLIATKISANRVEWAGDNYIIKSSLGRLNSDISKRNFFYSLAESYKMMYQFVSAIEYIARKLPETYFIVRPHPNEDIRFWQVCLKDIMNVDVVREGPITPWILNSEMLIHNGCTTALEAALAKRKIISYVPIPQYYDHILPNELGIRVKNKEDLAKKVQKATTTSDDACRISSTPPLAEFLRERILTDENILAAEKLINEWERLLVDQDQSKLPRGNPLGLATLKLRRAVGLIRCFFPKNEKRDRSSFDKVSRFSNMDLQNRINKLSKCLHLRVNVYCKVLGEHSVVISKRA